WRCPATASRRRRTRARGRRVGAGMPESLGEVAWRKDGGATQKVTNETTRRARGNPWRARTHLGASLPALRLHVHAALGAAEGERPVLHRGLQLHAALGQFAERRRRLGRQS